MCSEIFYLFLSNNKNKQKHKGKYSTQNNKTKFLFILLLHIITKWNFRIQSIQLLEYPQLYQRF